MVDVMPTLLALAGAKGSPDHPFDGKDVWSTVGRSQPSPHEDILINVEPFRGAIRRGNWKLVKIALLPGKDGAFRLADDPGEKNNVAEQFPEIVRDLEGRLSNLRARRSRASGSKRSRPSLARKVRRSSIRTSTSTTPACRTKSRSFPAANGFGL